MRSREPLETQLANADVVVVGEVTKRLDQIHWEMRVDAVARGSVGPWLVLANRAPRGCGRFGTEAEPARPPEGRRLYVGGYDGDVSGCGGNPHSDPDAVLASLRLTTYPPATDVPGRESGVVPLAVALTIASAFGVAYVRSRRPLPMPD